MSNTKGRRIRGCVLIIFILGVLGTIGRRVEANSDLLQPYITVPAGSWPEAIAIGDGNGDGWDDVVDPSMVTVLRR